MAGRSVLGSVAGGVIVTLATGLYNNTLVGLVGALSYGFPFTWLRRLVIAPQYNPWRIDTVGLIVDLAVWIVVIEVLYLSARSLKARGGGPKMRH